MQIPLAFLVILFSISSLTAQHAGGSKDSIVLCQGDFFTEKQGADFLKGKMPASAADWISRAEVLKRQLREGMDLTIMPEAPPLKPIIHNRRMMDGYSVANVSFESYHGFRVTGNLYQPRKRARSYPGVLSPHGHFENGRFHAQTQIRSANLARMGAVVFAWDMIGYGDSRNVAHRLANALRYQTLNSMRALDFLLSLEGVDSARIAVSGESGGGTQSFILAALDDRIRVTAPAVMVSAHFFGGCVCESGMPIHFRHGNQTNNVEIAALAAPRPQLLISIGNDWTRNTPQVEYPFLKAVYGLYGRETNVENVHLATEAHDYGPGKRQALYVFLAKHLGLSLDRIRNQKGKLSEEKVLILAYDELSVTR